MINEKKRVIAVVPIKMNNERLPGKNTKLLGNRPLIQYILTALNNSKKIDTIYVYCSNPEIQNYFIDSDRIVYLERPQFLDEKTSNFTQIFDNFSHTIDSDIYVFAHATAPYLSTETIDNCIDNVLLNGYDSSFTAEKIQDYLWSGNAPLNFDATNLPRSQDLDPIYRETSGVYVFEKEVFKNYKRRIGVNPRVVEVPFVESIDINYPKDFEMAELFYKYYKNALNKQSERKVSILDCTLRDGGCVNGFAFENNDIVAIKNGLELSGIENIELGYISNKGKNSDSTKFDSVETVNKLLINKNANCKYYCMIDYGTYDLDKLPMRDKKGIDGIRYAFHKKNIDDAFKDIAMISAKGYEVYIQPMVVMSYSDDEIMKLITFANDKSLNIGGLYLVDSFGQMLSNDVERIFDLMDTNLNSNIKLGFHGHNNMQMAFANTLAFINSTTARDIVVDSTIMGMGKGAGNLPTEILISYINKKSLGTYDESKIYAIVDSVICKYRDAFSWGYEPKFLLSALNSCTPSFVNYFTDKCNVNLSDLRILLGMLDSTKKMSSNDAYASEVYEEYKEHTK